jgi:hypothetical protein
MSSKSTGEVAVTESAYGMGGNGCEVFPRGSILQHAIQVARQCFHRHLNSAELLVWTTNRHAERRATISTPDATPSPRSYKRTHSLEGISMQKPLSQYRSGNIRNWNWNRVSVEKLTVHQLMTDAFLLHSKEVR